MSVSFLSGVRPLRGRSRLVAFLSATTVVAAIIGSLTIACGSAPLSAFVPPGTDTGTGASAGDSAPGSQTTDDAGSPFGSLLGDGGLVADDAPVYSDGAIILPDNFVPTEHGGYALGPPITGAGLDGGGLIQNGASQSCSLVLGVVRDFLSYGLQDGGDLDFEHFSGQAPTLTLVQSALGSDQKPVYGGQCDDNGIAVPPCTWGQQMTTEASFDQWYRSTPGVNLPYLVYLEFVPNGGVYTFQSNAYFPLDDAGFGNTPGFNHNFSFTTEVHMKFLYQGGETFSFTGDDDLWVFINGTLAMDLGGLHPSANGSISVDTLGLTKGSEYPLDLFNAERHSVGSDFEVDTDLTFTSCGTVPPDVPK
jgi:fibro-slime domain-containing protein